MVEVFGLQLSIFECVVLFLVVLTFALQIYYYTRIFGRLAFGRRKTSIAPPLEPVSVIICARNEQAALQKYLKYVLTQDYPEFEVIVVNDCSEDDSEVLLASMQKEYPHLSFRTIVKDDIFKHSKKMALGVGIKAAKYDLLLFIDADCFPAGNLWLRGMQSYFSNKTEVVLGYTRLVNNSLWIRADRMMHAFHFLGKALNGKPYMGVGSNLGYRKNLFFDNKGFDLRITENLREDRIFINKVAKAENTTVAALPEAATVSTLHISAQRWRRERHEELRSFALCKPRNRYPELAEALLRLVYFAAIALAIVQWHHVDVLLFSLLGVIVMRMGLQILVFVRSQKRLGESGLTVMLLLWDLIFPLFYIGLIFSSHLPRKKSGSRGLWN